MPFVNGMYLILLMFIFVLFNSISFISFKKLSNSFIKRFLHFSTLPVYICVVFLRLYLLSVLCFSALDTTKLSTNILLPTRILSTNLLALLLKPATLKTDISP